MPHTNSWLCQYSICQLGRPYWYGTSGQLASNSVYVNCVKSGGYYYSNYESQIGQKVHDCSGLVVGALTCEGVNDEPSSGSPIAHGATSQFNYNCSTHSNSMDDFPRIPGTLVFHTEGDYKSHVGVYVGEFIDADGESHSDAVVEAMGHDWGVVTTGVDSYNWYGDRRWDSWGQLDCCDVDTKIGQKFDARNLNSVASAGAIKINTEVMRPFVATFSETYNKSVNYQKLKDAKVSAVMFYGGQLYTAIRIKQKVYTNPYLANLVQDCKDNGMPYSLYVHVRARNEIEADEECRTLYYMVSRFLPPLGLWLSLDLGGDKDMNNKILEVYYRYLDKWGLTGRCGLYVTPEQLARITWTTFQDRFYLWEIASLDVTTVDDELLQPEMFEVPD